MLLITWIGFNLQRLRAKTCFENTSNCLSLTKIYTMKLTSQFCVVMLLSITLFSCSKTEKVLVKHAGGWNIDKSITTTTMDGTSTTTTEYDSGVATFADNGTGIIVYNGGFAESFKWSVAEDVITITYDLSTTSIPYTILDDSASDYQHWSGTYTYMLGPMEVVIDSDLTLSAIGD